MTNSGSWYARRESQRIQGLTLRSAVDKRSVRSEEKEGKRPTRLYSLYLGPDDNYIAYSLLLWLITHSLRGSFRFTEG